MSIHRFIYSRKLIRYILPLLLGVLCLLPTTAATLATYSATVYFRQGYRIYEPGLADNAATMERLLTALRSRRVDSVIVCAYASPEGSSTANDRLARLRCRTIANHIGERSGLPSLRVICSPGGIAWDELHRKVAADMSVPCRDEVLGILDNTLGRRKQALMGLHGGVPYRWLYSNIFPALRNAFVIVVYAGEDDEVVSPSVPADTVAESMDTVFSGSVKPPPELLPDVGTTAEPCLPELLRWQPFALGTNLIYDALLCPNLSFEWRFSEKYSVLAEADVAWWSNNRRHKYYQLMYLGAEGRRWFASRKPWHGFYAGIMAGGGKYDLENGGEGYKGEGLLAGLTFGYTFPVGARLSLDAGIGLGYMYTRYEVYHPFDGHYLYQRKADTSYFGPIRARLALVWRFGSCRKGGAQ